MISYLIAFVTNFNNALHLQGYERKLSSLSNETLNTFANFDTSAKLSSR